MNGNSNVTGCISSGGTESIFLTLKVAREVAREEKPGSTGWEIIFPETAHPAFLKACHYLDLKPVLIPVREDKRADTGAIADAINARTIMIACSAPCFPYGVIDPVTEVAQLARKHDLLFHVDACMGGFMLPFLEELGYPIPPFDFRVPGVSSISLDAHKYGYAPKGSSVILYRNRKLRRKQFFIHTEWPGGIFASTSFMGTKSGGPLAGTWAIMNHLGREGYLKIADEVMKTTVRIREGIGKIEGLRIISDPDMCVMAFTSENDDIFNIGDGLAQKGWYLDRLQFPDGLHMTVNQLNVGKEEELLQDLGMVMQQRYKLQKDLRITERSVNLVNGLMKIVPARIMRPVTRLAGKNLDSASGDSGIPQAALYGISASIKNRKNVKELVENLIDGIYS